MRELAHIAEALVMMRGALQLLDRNGSGSTDFAYHLSMAIAVAGRLEDGNGGERSGSPGAGTGRRVALLITAPSGRHA